jgi:transglutaminase-like putative cysteine protease
MVSHERLIRIEDVVKVLTYAIGIIGFLSIAPHLPPLFSTGFACFYFLSALIEYRKMVLVPRWVLNFIAIAFIIFTFTRMSMENFVLPSIEALSVLLLIKLFEEKRFRDYMQIYLMSVLLLAGAALLSLGMLFLVYFAALTALCSTALVLLTYYSQERKLALQASVVMRIITKSLLIPLAAGPMTVILFIVLPRTNYPMFDFLNRGGAAAATGFTDHVRLGTVSGIQEDTTIIFRVSMERISEDLLYWRGIVLDYFDGTSWKSSLKPAAEVSQLTFIPGKRIQQTIYLEPYENKYVFALDKPLSISLQRIQRSRDLTFSLPENITKRIKYHASSSLAEILPETTINRDLYLQLPGAGPGKKDKIEKIAALARRLARNDTEATVRSILSFLKNGDYRYGLQNLPLTAHPLEDFLFKYKYGNCEYFASAMAVMLRTAGIPARLVGGYRGGYYNEMGGYYIIPQRNAHVWVEAYLDHKGWVRVDPTPISSGSFEGALRKNLFFTMRLVFDSISYAWNASVINYDFEGQLSLLNALRNGIKRPAFNFRLGKEALIRYSLFTCVAVSVLYTFFILAQRRKSASEYILRLFLKKAGKLGYVKMKSEGLEEFVRKIEDPDKRERASLFVKEFEKYYFRDEEINQETSRRLKHLIKLLG